MTSDSRALRRGQRLGAARLGKEAIEESVRSGKRRGDRHAESGTHESRAKARRGRGRAGIARQGRRTRDPGQLGAGDVQFCREDSKKRRIINPGGPAAAAPKRVQRGAAYLQSNS